MSFSTSSYFPPLCRQFTFYGIEVATQNFDESLVIGCGGFGKVYRGTITCGEIGLDAAIKRLESSSNQGAAEFWAEIEMLSNLRHCHLVPLIGYCIDGQEMILVYEYIPNGTLAYCLHKRRASMTWVRRLKICIGAARGLDYLHTCTGITHGVIHRDVKSTNILLDDNWAATISDFGLSKIGPTNQSCTYVSTLVKGTFGYLDPHYFQTGRLTRKSDVYAFGVVLFEVLGGRHAVDRSIDDEEQWGLAAWAQDSVKEGRLEQIVDSNIRGRIFTKCLKEFALLAGRCLHSSPKQRPTMAEVVAGLESILVLQEETDRALLIKLYGRGVSTSTFPLHPENFAGGTSKKSLDLYLYTIGGEERIVYQFDFSGIVYATKNFSKVNRISHTTSGSMYKGRLQNGQDITITKYSYASAYRECMNEASILLKLEHDNVIQLLGYCIGRTNVYLLYDFAPYATLGGLIFDRTCNLLDWNKRCKIVVGVARELVYLHHHAPVPIIHRGVCPENILLDGNFDPKLSAFRFAVTVDQETGGIEADSVVRTVGSIAPEYLLGARLSTKVDVFNFGVLVLVTISGKRGFDLVCQAVDEDCSLLTYLNRNCLEGTLSHIIDHRIDVDSALVKKMIEIGLLCIQRDAVVRPTMEEVVDMLLGTLSLTLHVSKMRARMNLEPEDSDENEYEGSDTGEVEEFILELCPR